MNAFIQACIKANQELYEYITTHITQADYTYSNTIGEGGDNSLNMDLKAESIFVKHLQSFGTIYSEESGTIPSSTDNEYTIIIDPLDGSDNFTSGLPYYGTSVALKQHNEVVAGVVCNLVSGELVYRTNGKANFVHLFNASYLFHDYTQPKLALFERCYKFPKLCQILFEHNIKYRSPGAVALSLAYAHKYDFVLFAGPMRSFDLDAALHICKPLYIYQNNEILLVCKNYKKFETIKELLN